MQVISERHGDLLIIDLRENRLDAAGSVDFKEEFLKQSRDHTGRILLDLKGVEFLDSSGLGALVAVMKTLGGRKLELCDVGTIVRKVLTLTRMDQIFIVHDTRDAALAPRDAA